MWRQPWFIPKDHTAPSPAMTVRRCWGALLMVPLRFLKLYTFDFYSFPLLSHSPPCLLCPQVWGER